jgi:predicted alpha/beta hydrolase family esterase
MNKYKVKISHIFSEVIDIEAANEDEAKEKATAELDREDRESNIEYETTIPSENWPVISEEQLKDLIEQFEAANAKTKEEGPNIITSSIEAPGVEE